MGMLSGDWIWLLLGLMWGGILWYLLGPASPAGAADAHSDSEEDEPEEYSDITVLLASKTGSGFRLRYPPRVRAAVTKLTWERLLGYLEGEGILGLCDVTAIAGAGPRAGAWDTDLGGLVLEFAPADLVQFVDGHTYLARTKRFTPQVADLEFWMKKRSMVTRLESTAAEQGMKDLMEMEKLDFDAKLARRQLGGNSDNS